MITITQIMNSKKALISKHVFDGIIFGETRGPEVETKCACHVDESNEHFLLDPIFMPYLGKAHLRFADEYVNAGQSCSRPHCK